MMPGTGDPPSPLAIDTELQGQDSARLTLAGELDIATVPQLEKVLSSLLCRGVRQIAIDLSQVTFIDSSALRMFIVLTARATSEDWSLRIVNPSEQARSVFEITGAEQHLRVESEPR
jgi:anti-sigma B factor antagonist